MDDELLECRGRALGWDDVGLVSTAVSSSSKK